MPDALEALQARTLGILAQHVPAGEPAALLDFPSHRNAGDSLIYRGQRAYLERLGIPVAYVADIFRYSPSELRRRVPHGPLILQGGGNLGDRWLETQRFRERVVRDFGDRTVIQFPQSCEFRSSAAEERARAVFSAHPNLTLLIRETPSYERACIAFPSTRVEYCPDVAFGVGHLERVREPQFDVIMVLRSDSEKVVRDFPLSGHSVRRVDWGLHGARAVAWNAVSAAGFFARRIPPLKRTLYSAVARGYEAQASLNLSTARDVVSSGRVLVTDRLHAAVLGALMGVPTVALDNVYGKVSSIYRDYLGTLPGVRFASTGEEAAAMAESALRTTTSS